MVLEIDACVSEYQYEKHRHREAEALQMLRKIASLVKPIMRQRAWRIGVLTEFFPQETNLLGLNVNKGQRICLRLRYPGDERQFLPLEQVVDTMLHELSHIVHGPHDEAFHSLWNQLREEHEQLLRKGYTGEGFLSEGRKLGGNRIPMHEARRQARAAAEKRRILTAGSGQKLGGAPVRREQDIRKIIADAATRRTAVTKGCASGTSAEREKQIIQETNKNGFRTKAEEDDANEEAIMLAFIDLVQEEEREKYGVNYVPPSAENPWGSQSAPIPIKSESEASASSKRPNPDLKSPPVPASTKPPPPTLLPSRPKSTATKPIQPVNDTWTCGICTLINPATFLVCDACGTDQPSPPVSPSRKTPSITSSTQARPSSIKDSNAKKAVRSLMSLDATVSQMPKKPLAWSCHKCGTYTEAEWWTCAQCGTMKLSS
ncbi:hypothetical protein ACLMJK_006902 [Lecanora helva]